MIGTFRTNQVCRTVMIRYRLLFRLLFQQEAA